MKLSREQVKDLIKGVVHEMIPAQTEKPSNSDAAVDSTENPDIATDPIEYAVKVSLEHTHEGDQLKAEALIWDEAIDKSESNHIKMELEKMVGQFIKDKNRESRRIR